MAVAGEARHGFLTPTQVTSGGVVEGHGIHVPYQWIAEDETTRLSITVAASDVGKWAYQQDDGSIWVLADDSPITWTLVGVDAGLFYTQAELDGGVLDTRYYTETELDSGALDTRYYTETELDGGVLDTRYYTETELNSSGAGGQVHWANVTSKGSIDDLSDVDTTTVPPILNDGLVWDGANWIPGVVGSGAGGCEIFDNILTDGTSVLLDGDGNVLYTPC